MNHLQLLCATHWRMLHKLDWSEAAMYTSIAPHQVNPQASAGDEDDIKKPLE
jgi:hypothetical protein